MTATRACRATRKPALSCSALPRLTGSRSTRQRAITGGGRERRRLGAVAGAVVEHEHLEHGIVGGERRRDAQARSRSPRCTPGSARRSPASLLPAPRPRPAPRARRNSRPPAIHSAAVQTGYSATNASSASATVRQTASPVDVARRRRHESTSTAMTKAPDRHREPERDRGGLVDHPGERGRAPRATGSDPAPRPRSAGRAMPGAAARSAAREPTSDPWSSLRPAGPGSRADSQAGGPRSPAGASRPGLLPDQPAIRAAKAAMPAAPQCHDGSARSRGRPPVRFSYQNAP